MTLQHRFEAHKDQGRYNTSYPLSPQDWAAYRTTEPLSFENEKELSFYLHIPFCKSLCRFCEYVKYPIPEEALQMEYLEILQRDMERFVATLPKEGYGKPVAMLRGFDIGGGTPTALSHKALEKLLVIMNRSVEQFNLGENFLASIEGSFSTIDKDKIAIIGELGRRISRISFGLQNINPLWLKAQNRSSSPVNHIITNIEECRKAGIRIIRVC